MKIPEFVVGLPPETFINGQTVYWWNGEHWTERRFVDNYQLPLVKAVKLRLKLREQIVPATEVISRERYLNYKASQFHK